MQMNLAELQKEAHAIAKEKGWWDKERTLGDLIALVHSELSEALEAYREYDLKDWRSHTYDDGFVDEHPDGEKPEGVPSELADVVIRVADMAEWYEWKLPKRQLLAFDPNESFGEHIVSAHEMLSGVRGSEPAVVLSDFVEYIRAMASHYGINLDAAIEAKMEHNRTREYRHGGKAL